MSDNLRQQLEQWRTQTGQTFAEVADAQPALTVFLRHSGCPFCREALAEIAKARESIEAQGVQIVLVHMMNDAQAESMFAKYHLDDVARISDPDQELYAAFELTRGGMGEVMGPRIWWRGFRTTFLQGNTPGKPEGDVFQLPGTFLVYRGEILKAYRSKDSADKPDYADFAACELPAD